MAAMTGYFIVCDRCGRLLANRLRYRSNGTPRLGSDEWHCDCNGRAAWAFPTLEAARQYQADHHPEQVGAE